MAQPHLSRSVQRALDVLELLAATAQTGGANLTDLSRELGLPKSTVHRLLANLEERGFIEEEPNRKYRIGLRLFSIGSQAMVGNDLRRRARPFLEELVAHAGEAAYLAIADQNEVLYLDRMEGPHPIRGASPVGARRAMHATAVGKVLLASMTSGEVDQVIAQRGLAQLSPSTITDETALRSRIATVRQLGFEVDRGEYEDGLTCIAVPVLADNGRTAAAVGVSGPSWRIPEARIPSIVDMVRRAGSGLSRELGYRVDLKTLEAM